METDFEPPTAAEVARRAVILKRLLIYVATAAPATAAQFSTAPMPDGGLELDEQREERRLSAIAELRDSGLWEHAAPSERAIFEQPVSALTQRQVIAISWRAESLHCLAWSLELAGEIPDYDTLTDPDILMPLIPTADIVDACRSATLRAHEMIEEARDIAELWHWRSRTRQLEEDGYVPRPGQASLDRIVRDTAPRMAASGLLPAAIDEDFPVLGRAYRDLSNREWTTVRSIAMDRYFALNWLSGYAPGNEWDETPTDT